MDSTNIREIIFTENESLKLIGMENVTMKILTEILVFGVFRDHHVLVGIGILGNSRDVQPQYQIESR